MAREISRGVMDRLTIEAAVTVTVAEAAGTPATVAVMVVVPGFRAVTRPWALTIATLVLDEAQVADCVKSSVLPSDMVAEAAICCESPAASVTVAGVTVIDCTVEELTVKVMEVVTDPRF